MSSYNLHLPMQGLRCGKMGSVALGIDYMAGVRARARMLAKATKLPGEVVEDADESAEVVSHCYEKEQEG